MDVTLSSDNLQWQAGYTEWSEHPDFAPYWQACRTQTELARRPGGVRRRPAARLQPTLAEPTGRT